MVHSGLAVAFAAVHWSTFSGLKWNFGLFATLDTYGRIHLTTCLETGATVTLLLTGLATLWTTFGLISESFRLKELLLPSAEYKARTTIGTLKCLILEAHRMTLLSYNSWFLWSSCLAVISWLIRTPI